MSPKLAGLLPACQGTGCSDGENQHHVTIAFDQNFWKFYFSCMTYASLHFLTLNLNLYELSDWNVTDNVKLPLEGGRTSAGAPAELHSL